MIALDISIKNKCYGNSDAVVLKDINFSVKPGEFVAIIGPSGCGKSTLLNMLCGLEESSEQKLLCNGKAINGDELHKLGYIFQQPRLMPWLTVQENLQLVLPLSQHEQIDDLLTQVGLSGKGGYFPKQLSGGMQRRVAIARAFAVNPELILLDEPFNSLDAPTAAKLRLLLVKLCQNRGSTVIFVTHDLSEAVYLADRIIFMSNTPTSIIHQIKVNLTKPRQEAGSKELAWQAKLMDEHPKILAGKTN
ncbi:nitrate ABC transporter ATP-binding protein [Thalassotalea sp. 42_200_T64]|nr:nitrate ABC transporter ATP-binding protein [Thalassotalea sp. 42_200_T64]